MKLLRRTLALVLLAAIMLSSVPAVFATSYSDIGGHWAEKAIQDWSDWDVLHGYTDGTFKPDSNITRGEAAQVIKNLMRIGDNKSTDNPFTDIQKGDWYYDAIIKAVAAGYIEGYGDGTVRPEINITREEMMIIISRVLRINKAETIDLNFSDADSISAWAKSYVYGLVNAGIVYGFETGDIRPQQNITRAEVVAILRRAVTTYAYQEGNTYNAINAGITLAVADNVTIMKTLASLLVGDGADNGEVYLQTSHTEVLKLPAEYSTVYVSCDSTVNKANVSVTGTRSKVVYCDGTEIGEGELPGGPAEIPGGPAAIPSSPNNPPSSNTSKDTYKVSIKIQETTVGGGTGVVSKEIDYYTSHEMIQDVYTQLTAAIIADFRKEFKDRWANLIMLEGINAYIEGNAKFIEYVDKYISDVSQTSASNGVNIMTSLRNRSTIGSLGVGTWAMVYNVQQGSDLNVYRQYTVTITIA